MSLLKRLFKGNSSSGLNDDQILELEQKLNKKIPKSYRDFLQNYPNELIKLGYPYNTVSELSLPNTVERIVEINEFEEVDKNILVIGVNGLGDFYYIILDEDTNKIHEAADVFYHLLMYLESNNVKIEEVMVELENRKK